MKGMIIFMIKLGVIRRNVDGLAMFPHSEFGARKSSIGSLLMDAQYMTTQQR
jgi:hypothetical protein